MPGESWRKIRRLSKERQSQARYHLGYKAGSSVSTVKKEERIRTILELCRRKGAIVRSDVETVLGVSQSTAILLLRELTDTGVLIKKGKTKNLKYYANE